MIITLVTDQFYQNSNGTSVSAQNLCKGLIENGHTVRILSVDNGENTPYALKERNFGKIGNKIIHSQGMQLAKPENKIIKEAINGADIVHIITPFKLGQKTLQICKKNNIPCTAAFHLVPENITSTIYMKNLNILNDAIWTCWRGKLYKNIEHIHCPSRMVADQMKKHGYNSNLHIISNGFKDCYMVNQERKPKIFKDKIIIVATGRLSREKRYDLLIKAVNKSKYKDKILIIFGGNGPLKKSLIKKSSKLPNMPLFLGKYDQKQQLSLLNYADLYIHTADIEVEGMTCLEASACGCVPIVSDSPKSATKQFVTHKQSIFKHGNYKDLASKIDWWIENPEFLENQKKIVSHHAQNYRLENSMKLYIDMFNCAIKDFYK